MRYRTYAVGILSFMAASAHAGPIGIDLGKGASFAVFAGTTVTNTGATVVNGNLGVWPGTSVTGFPPGIIVNGALHAGDSVAAAAWADLVVAYDAAATAPTGTVMTGVNLGGQTLTPGTYSFADAAQLTGTLTLDGGGSRAAFLFKVGSALTTASASSVVLINAGMGSSIVFQVGSSATLGAGTAFTGSILALSDITLGTGATVQSGGAFAQKGAVSLSGNTVSMASDVSPATDIPEPHSILILTLGALLATAGRLRNTCRLTARSY